MVAIDGSINHGTGGVNPIVIEQLAPGESEMLHSLLMMEYEPAGLLGKLTVIPLVELDPIFFTVTTLS